MGSIGWVKRPRRWSHRLINYLPMDAMSSPLAP